MKCQSFNLITMTRYLVCFDSTSDVQCNIVCIHWLASYYYHLSVHFVHNFFIINKWIIFVNYSVIFMLWLLLLCNRIDHLVYVTENIVMLCPFAQVTQTTFVKDFLFPITFSLISVSHCILYSTTFEHLHLSTVH